MDDLPRKKFISAFISVYICLYIVAFGYIPSTDSSRYTHLVCTHISLISVHIGNISYQLAVAGDPDCRGGSPIHTEIRTGHTGPDLGYKQ